MYQYQDLKREKYYNDDKDVYYYKWGDQPIFEMNDAENAIVLSVGETYTITYNPSTFGALSEVYSWSISGGDGIYADGTGRSCKVTAMKKGTGKVTATCIYTVKAADILTGNPTTEQRSTSKIWYFKVE